MKNLINKFALIALMASASVMAATDGNLDTTSSVGSTDVKLIVGETVQVSFPSADIDLTYSTTVDAAATEEFCIYTNDVSAQVGVAIGLTNNNTSGTGAAPVLINGTSDEVPYSLALKTAAGAQVSAGADNITEDGLAAFSISNANNSSTDCSIGGNSHEFVVGVLATDMAAAPGGSYSDTITVTVTPTI